MAARLLGTWCLVAAFAQGDDEAWARAATLATAPRSDELVLERSCQGLGHGPVGLGNVVRRVPRYLRAAAARNSSLAFVAVDAFAELCEAFDCRGRLRRRGAGPSHDCAADRFAAYATAGERGRFDAAHDAELRAVLGGPNAAVMGRLRHLWRGPPAAFEALVAARPRAETESSTRRRSTRFSRRARRENSARPRMSQSQHRRARGRRGSSTPSSTRGPSRATSGAARRNRPAPSPPTSAPARRRRPRSRPPRSPRSGPGRSCSSPTTRRS